MGRPKRLYPLGKYRLRTPKVVDKEKAYPVELEYTWNRQIIRKTTNVFVKVADWNQNGNQGLDEIRASHGNEAKRLNQLLLARVERIDSQLAEYHEKHPNQITADVVSGFLADKPLARRDQGKDFVEFTLERLSSDYSRNRIGRSRYENGKSCMNIFQTFLRATKQGTYRSDELSWKPFKSNSKIPPNCCAKFVFGGNHDRTLEMAFGNQSVNLEKGADNSHLHRCEEIENWAKDVYDWCVQIYGQENIVGFQVHLDESSPHIHALVVPVGIRPKSGRECVMWSAKFGKDRYEYGRILKEMRTSLYEDVGSKYGLERGDSIDGRNVQHLHKRDYIRKLTKEAKQAEKAVKGLQSMMQHLESKIFSYRLQLEEAEKKLVSGRITLDRYEAQKADI